jgi:hypothetical protein
VRPISSAKLLSQQAWRRVIRSFDRLRFTARNERELPIWQGWPVEACADPDAIQLFLAHIRDVICSGDESYANTLLDWCAYTVQNLDTHNRFALVLLGQEGAGKNTFTDAFCDLFGSAFSKKNVNDMA